MVKGTYKYYKDLPSWAKGVIVVSAVGIVVVAGITIYKQVSKIGSKTKSDATSLTTNNDQTVSLQKAGMTPSYLDTQYTSWADEIENSLDACNSWNWDTGSKVKDIMSKMNNVLDITKLINAFGLRQYHPCFTNVVGLLQNVTGQGTGKTNLASWITDNVSSSDISEINSKFSSNNINYSF